MILDQPVVCPIFIGRQNDLQLLDRLMVQLGNQHGQVALISGEAGIGKSRLVKEAKARAPEGTLILAPVGTPDSIAAHPSAVHLSK